VVAAKGESRFSGGGLDGLVGIAALRERRRKAIEMGDEIRSQ
jgi:hypothetical protein